MLHIPKSNGNLTSINPFLGDVHMDNACLLQVGPIQMRQPSLWLSLFVDSCPSLKKENLTEFRTTLNNYQTIVEFLSHTLSLTYAHFLCLSPSTPLSLVLS